MRSKAFVDWVGSLHCQSFARCYHVRCPGVCLDTWFVQPYNWRSWHASRRKTTRKKSPHDHAFGKTSDPSSADRERNSAYNPATLLVLRRLIFQFFVFPPCCEYWNKVSRNIPVDIDQTDIKMNRYNVISRYTVSSEKRKNEREN